MTMRLLRVLLSLSLVGTSLPAYAMPAERWLPDSSPTISSAHHLGVADVRLPRLPAALPSTRVVSAPVGAAAAAARGAEGVQPATASPLAQARALDAAVLDAGAAGGAAVESFAAADQIWSHSRAGAPAGIESPLAAAAVVSAARPSLIKRGAVQAGRGAAFAGGVALPTPAGSAVSADAQVALHQMTPWMPYAIVGAGLVATHYASKLAAVVVDFWTRRAKTDEHTAELLRLSATVLTWGVGATLTLHVAGVSLETVLASVGGVGGAVALLIGQEIGNLIEGTKVLIARPFRRGDRLRKGGKDYTVKAVEVRYVDLGVYHGSDEPNEYRQLAAAPFTVHRPYEAPAFVKREVAAASAWLGLSLAAVFGVPWLVGLAGWGWLTTLLPWLKAAAIIVATRRFELWAAALVEKILTAMKRTRSQIDAWTFIARAVTYLGGLSFVLHAFNLSWLGAMTSVGVSSLILGYIVRDTLTSLYLGIKILMTQPFRVGDVIEAAAVTGRVVEMNLFYVVLEHKEKTHTLIPYAVFDKPAVRLSERDADTSMPKLTPGISLPPSERDAAQGPKS
jgi:small-conductance mechanosensitive channel